MDTQMPSISTEPEYEAAMAEVERLWGAGSGTPEGDRLDRLATQIDAYEAQRWPMDTPGLVEASRFHLGQQDLAQTELELTPRDQMG